MPTSASMSCDSFFWIWGSKIRVRGSHHIFVRPGVEELVNLQRSGSKAKPYQVRQVRAVITRHGLWSEE